jgi:hypothetical protein
MSDSFAGIGAFVLVLAFGVAVVSGIIVLGLTFLFQWIF